MRSREIKPLGVATPKSLGPRTELRPCGQWAEATLQDAGKARFANLLPESSSEGGGADAGGGWA